MISRDSTNPIVVGGFLLLALSWGSGTPAIGAHVASSGQRFSRDKQPPPLIDTHSPAQIDSDRKGKHTWASVA